MEQLKRIFLLLPILSLLQAAAFGQSSTGRPAAFPRVTPDPLALQYYRPDGNDYTWTELAEISLWASGEISPSVLASIRTHAAAINESPALPDNTREKAEFILEYMHKNILRSYSINQTRVDTIFTNGRYNCVSSAVLYMIFCKSAGIDVSGVAARDHAFATVNIDGEIIDVETTNPYGFDPGSRREFHDNFGRLTGFAYVPARNYRDRQAINQIELVSLILWNRISVHESGNRYADAVPLAIDRAFLLLGDSLTASADHYSDLFEDPRTNLMDRLFNYGASLLRAGREEDCLSWAGLASPAYPDEDRWQDFIHASVNNRLNRFLQRNQTSEARIFLENQKSVLTAGNYLKFDMMLIDSELLSSANRIRGIEDAESIIAAIEDARVNEKINPNRAAELLTYTVTRTANILCAAPLRDWLAAINYIKSAIERFGSNRDFEQALRTYQNNRAVDFHNRFAAAWNRRDFDEAERILDEGLAEFPDNRQLLTDRQSLERQRARN